jgi:hypothetical protein
MQQSVERYANSPDSKRHLAWRSNTPLFIAQAEMNIINNFVNDRIDGSHKQKTHYRWNIDF